MDERRLAKGVLKPVFEIFESLSSNFQFKQYGYDSLKQQIVLYTLDKSGMRPFANMI